MICTLLLRMSIICASCLLSSSPLLLLQERKSCLLELKMSMKKSMEFGKGGSSASRMLSDTFSKNDYRVAAIEKWFEGEVARVHRKVELLVEVGEWVHSSCC